MGKPLSNATVAHLPSSLPVSARECVFVFSILACCRGFAAESMGPGKTARRYLGANLVLIGDVVSCTTQTVQKEDSLRDDGWMYHYTTFVDVYSVRVDSVLKGRCADSIIVIQSKLFGGNTSRSKFLEVDEKGDSLYVAEATVGNGGGGADRINKPGRHIIMLLMVPEQEDTTYTSTFCSPYSRSRMDFFREVEKKGEDYFRTLEPQN